MCGKLFCIRYKIAYLLYYGINVNAYRWENKYKFSFNNSAKLDFNVNKPKQFCFALFYRASMDFIMKMNFGLSDTDDT